MAEHRFPKTVRTGGESGAVVPIIALALVAILGVVVLVVDVGGLLYTRRQLVNSSDSAALAAAQSCAKVNDVEDPESIADVYAADNVTGAETATTNILEAPGCDTGGNGYVRLGYDKEQPLFFGPVLGAGPSATVHTEATADWGGLGTADGVIPLVIYSGFLQGPACDVPDVPEGTTCYFWEDNDLSGEGNFGFLDVRDGWNVERDEDCPNSGGDNQLEDWINGSDPIDTLEINYPLATWVCTRDGNHSEPHVWDAVRDLIGQTRTFPVVGSSPGDGEPQQLGTPKPKYNVIGFAQMEIEDVLTVQNTAPITCTLSIPATATKPIDLLAAGAIPCAIPANASFAGVTQVTPGNVQWSVSPAGLFTWTGNRRPNSVRFQYTIPSTSCGGQPAPNSSAHCLVLTWQGYSFEEGEPGSGGNFGHMAISLCDTRFDSCVDPS